MKVVEPEAEKKWTQAPTQRKGSMMEGMTIESLLQMEAGIGRVDFRVQQEIRLFICLCGARTVQMRGTAGDGSVRAFHIQLSWAVLVMDREHDELERVGPHMSVG